MITGELKNKVDKIWEVFWTGGITNPLEVIEQFTYLLFIRQLDDVETTKENEAGFLGVEFQGMFPPDCQEYRWSRFKNLGDAQEIYNIVLNGVFPFIKNLHQDGDSAYSKYMGDAIFKVPTPAMLTKLIDGIDALDLGDSDSKGDLYEYLLSKVATAGTNGQFRTPRHIIKMMVELVRPNPTDRICDPAMGSAGFLVEAQTYLREHEEGLFFDAELNRHFHEDMFFGFDMDRTMLRIGAMNMLLHGVDNPGIEYCDSLSENNTDFEKYTLVLANPPFKGSLDYEGVSTAILVFTKTGAGGTEKVWFYDMKADGFSLDDKRQPVQENDIPDIVRRYHNQEKEAERKRTEQSFFVKLSEIQENDYDLSINKYKEIEYEAVHYDPPLAILDRIEKMEEEIQKGMAELRELLSAE